MYLHVSVCQVCLRFNTYCFNCICWHMARWKLCIIIINCSKFVIVSAATNVMEPPYDNVLAGACLACAGVAPKYSGTLVTPKICKRKNGLIIQVQQVKLKLRPLGAATLVSCAPKNDSPILVVWRSRHTQTSLPDCLPVYLDWHYWWCVTDTLSLDDTRISFNSRCSEEKVTSFISGHLQTAYLKAETNHELHYILPFDEAKKGGFEKLFSALDSALDDLYIASYGIADTNLEEVFLKITESLHLNSDNTGKQTSVILF